MLKFLMVLLVALLLGGSLAQKGGRGGKGGKGGKSSGGGGDLGRCKNCVYVMERIKQGYHYLLPNICEEVMAKTSSDEEYATCHKVLAGLSQWGYDVKHWLRNGCYRVEPYGAMSLVQPCPSHVICSKITDLEKTAFCADILTDFSGEDATKA